MSSYHRRRGAGYNGVMLATIDWGPVSAWLAAVGTIFAASIALLGGFRVFDLLRAPHLRLTFEHREPWCRADAVGLWVRIRVENVRGEPARGCVGQVTRVTTGNQLRPDIDHMPLEWAGFPRSRSFDPVDLRHDQHQFLDVFLLRRSSPRIEVRTFTDIDYDPGFDTWLTQGEEHVVEVTAFADNAKTETISIRVNYHDATPPEEAHLSTA